MGYGEQFGGGWGVYYEIKLVCKFILLIINESTTLKQPMVEPVRREDYKGGGFVPYQESEFGGY